MIKITKTTKADDHTVYTLEAYKDNEVIYDDSVEVTKDTKLDEAAIKKVLILTLLHNYYPIIVDELAAKIQVEDGT